MGRDSEATDAMKRFELEAVTLHSIKKWAAWLSGGMKDIRLVSEQAQPKGNICQGMVWLLSKTSTAQDL